MTARALYWVTPEGNIGTFKQGTAFTYDFIATTDDETVAVTYAVTSTLPSGFTFSGSVLSATSAVVTGEHSFTISASATVNSTLTTVSRTFKIKVASYDFNLATGVRLGRINENSDYSLQLELEHTPGYSVRFKNGGLPQDMTISESGLISGKIINYSSLDDYQLWGLYVVVERINANNEVIDYFVTAPFIKVVKWLKWVTPQGRLGEFSAYDAVDIQLHTSYPTLFKRLEFSVPLGTLPRGLSLSSTGRITGRISPENISQTNEFTVTINGYDFGDNLQHTTTRTFAIISNAWYQPRAGVYQSEIIGAFNQNKAMPVTKFAASPDSAGNITYVVSNAPSFVRFDRQSTVTVGGTTVQAVSIFGTAPQVKEDTQYSFDLSIIKNIPASTATAQYVIAITQPLNGVPVTNRYPVSAKITNNGQTLVLDYPIVSNLPPSATITAKAQLQDKVVNVLSLNDRIVNLELPLYSDTRRFVFKVLAKTEPQWVTEPGEIKQTTQISSVGFIETEDLSMLTLNGTLSSITEGMLVTGPQIVDGTRVQTVSGNMIGLDKPASTSSIDYYSYDFSRTFTGSAIVPVTFVRDYTRLYSYDEILVDSSTVTNIEEDTNKIASGSTLTIRTVENNAETVSDFVVLSKNTEPSGKIKLKLNAELNKETATVIGVTKTVPYSATNQYYYDRLTIDKNYVTTNDNDASATISVGAVLTLSNGQSNVVVQSIVFNSDNSTATVGISSVINTNSQVFITNFTKTVSILTRILNVEGVRYETRSYVSNIPVRVTEQPKPIKTYQTSFAADVYYTNHYDYVFNKISVSSSALTTAGIGVNSYIIGSKIAPDTFVINSEVDSSDSTRKVLTISKNVSDIFGVQITGVKNRSTGYISEALRTITMRSTSGILVGDIISGKNVKGGTTVQSISSTAVTMSTTATKSTIDSVYSFYSNKVFQERTYQEFPFVAQPVATGDYIKYTVLNGTTPLGLTLDTQGVLKGVLGEVATLTTYSFTIRATEYDQTETPVGQADRSFIIQVAGATPPVFYTEPGMICNMAKLPDITTPSAKINSIKVNGDNSVTVSISPFSLTAHGIVNNTCISFDGITGTGTSILNNNIFYAGNCDPANSSFKLYLNKGITNPTNQFSGQSTWTFLRTGSVSGCAVDSEYFEAQLSAGTSDPGVTVEYSIVSGALPLGLSMNSSGKILGYPTAKLETYDEQGVVSYSGAVDSNGNPAIKIGTFVVQAASSSGNTQAQFSIAVVNQEYDWNLEQTLNGTNYQFGGRRPVIINNKPLSTEISISDINRPYYFTGNSLGTFKQDSQMQFKLIGKNFNATPDQEIDWETTYYISGIRTAQPDSSNAFVATATFNNADSNVVMNSLDGLSTAPAGGYITFFGQKVGNIASNAPENSFVDVSTSYKYVVTDATNKIINLFTTTGALITPEIGGTLFTRNATTLVSPNTNAIAANGWISGSLAAVTPDNATYTINAQVQSPNLITSVSSTTTANIGSANLVVDKAYGFYAGQPVSVSVPVTTGSLSNSALYTISSIANSVTYNVDLTPTVPGGTTSDGNVRLFVGNPSLTPRYGTLDGIKANTRVQYVSTSPSANVTLYVDNLTQYGNTTVGTTAQGTSTFTFANVAEKSKFALGDTVYFDANSNDVQSNVPYIIASLSGAASNTCTVRTLSSISSVKFAASTGITMTKIAPTITLKYANGVAYVPSMSPTTIANITCQANVVTLRDTANASVSPRITGNITLTSTATIPLISDVYEYTFLVAGDSKSTIGWNTESELGTINNGAISRFKLDASFASDTVQTKAIFVNNNKNIRLTTSRSLTQDMPVKFIGTPVGTVGNIATFYINSIDSANNIIQIRSTEAVSDSLIPTANGNMTLTATIPDGRYKITDGSLPPGLKLLSTGEIVGRVAFEQGTTVQTSNASQTYSFTVQAYSKRFPSSTLNRVFTIKTTQRHTGPYDNLYITGLMNADQRATVADLLTYINGTHNNSIKADIYRPGDSNFGIAKGLKYVHMYGVPSVPTDDFYNAYVEAIARNHYYKNLSLGELKTAVARDSTGAIVYELVYCEVVDNLQNTDGISITKEIIWGQSVSIDGVTPTQPTVYPNSLSNMRDQIEQKIGNINDSSVLPLWMLSTQADGKVPGFTQCWVLCYTKPGKSASVLATIKSYLGDNSLSMNSINFGMDRLMVDRALTYTYGVGGNESWPSYNVRTTGGNTDIVLGNVAGLRVNQKVKPLTTIGNFDSTTDYFITDVNPATSTIRVRTQLYGNIANTVLTPNVTANTTLVTSPLSSTLQDDTRNSFVVFYQSSPLDSTAS